MNANELADELDSISYDCTIEEWRASPVGNAANMLRQQAKEIERLKKELALWKLSKSSEEIERELTDEEIMKIHGEILERPHFQQVYLDPLKFARAILKKASEK